LNLFQKDFFLLEKLLNFECYLQYMTTIPEKFILKIGSKGEIFPPKEIRKKLGLIPNQPILVTVHQDKLIIRKLHTIENILETPPKVKISYHAWKQFKKEMNEELNK